MITIDEKLILQTKLEPSLAILVEKITDLFNDLSYVAYVDEITEFINNETVDTVTYTDNIKSLLEFHLDRVGVMLGVHFSNESTLYTRYEVLNCIVMLPNLDPAIKDSLVIHLESEESYIDKLHNILDEVSKTTLDTYTSVNHVDEELMDKLNEILSVDEEVDLSHELDVSEKLHVFKRTFDKPPDSNILAYYRNKDNRRLVSITTILFRDKFKNKVAKELLELVMTMLIFSEADKEDYLELYVNEFSKFIDPNYTGYIDNNIEQLISNL